MSLRRRLNRDVYPGTIVTQENWVTPDQIKESICREVSIRFVNEGLSTSRRQLVIQYKTTEVFRELTDRDVLREVGNRPNDVAYVPGLGAFLLSGDTNLLQLVRQGMIVVVQAAQQLFFESDPTAKLEFSSEDVLRRVKKQDSAINPAAVRLGLTFAGQKGAFSGYSHNPETTEINTIYLADSIVNIQNAERWVDEQLARYRNPNPPPGEGHHSYTVQELNAVIGGIDPFEPARSGFDWDLLHPEVRRVARKRFEAGHLADAVLAAMRHINEKLQEVYRKARGEDRDGAALVMEVFSSKTPILLLGDLNTLTGQSMQLGYMQIFAGAMTGIRNPKAHGNIDIDANRATHFLFLASLLMYKIDEAQPAN